MNTRQKFSRYIVFALLGLTGIAAVSAQTPEAEKINGDLCHVYVIDNKKAFEVQEALNGKINETEFKKLLDEMVVEFPEFEASNRYDEENLQVFQFPNSKLNILAYLFYTTDSMTSYGKEDGSETAGSVIMKLALVKGKIFDPEEYEFQEGDIRFESELSYTEQTNMAKIRFPARVNDTDYTIGMQCDFMAKNRKTRIPAH